MKRLKALAFGWKNQPTSLEIAELEARYKSMAAPDMGSGDLLDLIRVSRYAEMGEMKALRFAYGLGYQDGKRG